MPFAEINHTNLFFRATGKGIPIILIHPPLLTKENFFYQQENLSEFFRIITFDIRGHGDSKPTDEEITYSLIVKDIIALMNHLEIEKAFIGGYSTGASIAFEAILNYPERFLGGIIIGGMSEASGLILRNEIKIGIAITKYRWKRLIAHTISKSNANNKVMYQRLYQDAMKGDIAHWHQYYKCSLFYNCTNRLNEIKQPMLLIYGKTNFMFYPYANILKNGLLNHSLYMIDGKDHQLPTKAAEKTNQVIQNWLKKICNTT